MPPQRRGIAVHLDHRGFLGIEGTIGEARAQHQHGVGAHQRVVARREADQPGHAHVIRVVVFDVFLAAQRVHDRCLQGLGHGHQLGVCAGATCARQDGRRLGLVQQPDQLVDFGGGGRDSLRLFRHPVPR